MLDLLLQNGTLIDPSQGLRGRYDLGISAGNVVSLFKREEMARIPPAKQTVNAANCFITPGLIDIHTHVFAGGADLGIDADTVGVRQGVTTVVDAGSAGVDTFPEFLAKVIKGSSTGVLAWLNIARKGLRSGLSELADLADLAPAETVDLIRKNEKIRGIKVRMSGSVVQKSGIEPLKVARRAAQEGGVPLMVHIGNAPPPLTEILDLLEKGDVVTHVFHGKPGGIFDARGALIPQARAALERGVLFDVGHGRASFSFKTMQRAMELGILPYSLSTDIYEKNINGPVFSLTVTMSKFLALGFSLEQIIAATTWAPAKILRLEERIGTLRCGTVADITVLQLTDGPVDFVDSEGDILHGEKLIKTKYTIKSGRVIEHHDSATY